MVHTGYLWSADSAAYGAFRVLIKFDITSIPTNAVVYYADITFTANNIVGTNILEAYRVTKNWTEGLMQGLNDNSNATWLTATAGSSWTAPGGDFDTTPASVTVTVNSTTSFSVILQPSVVQGWIADPSQNNGIILKDDNESGSHFIFLYTKNIGASNITYRPKLTVKYYIP
jgi:hypothetical protein